LRAPGQCRLYGILDLGYVYVNDAARIASRMLEGGVDILQLRAKGRPAGEILDIAGALLSMTAEAGVPLILNDFPELVAPSHASGAHIGQDDGSIARARRLAGEGSLIGRSTHSLEQAVAAQQEGADYIGFGPLFATPTKPDYAPIGLDMIRRVHELVRLPIFCIGGVKLENLEQVVAAGAARVVIVSGILKADDIVTYSRNAKKILLTHAGG